MATSAQESHIDQKEARVGSQAAPPENNKSEPFSAPEQADVSSRKILRDLSGAYSIYRAFK